MQTNAIIFLYHHGYGQVEEPGGGELGYRIEGALGLGAYQTEDAAALEAQSELDRLKVTREEVSLRYHPAATDEVRPYRGFAVGDAPTLIDTPIRCVAIAVKETDDGYIDYEPTFGELLSTRKERDARALEKFSHGTLGGDSKIAQPINPPSPRTRLGQPGAPARPPIYCATVNEAFGDSVGFVEAEVTVPVAVRSTVAVHIVYALPELGYDDLDDFALLWSLDAATAGAPTASKPSLSVATAVTLDPGDAVISARIVGTWPTDISGRIQILAIVGENTEDHCFVPSGG